MWCCERPTESFARPRAGNQKDAARVKWVVCARCGTLARTLSKYISRVISSSKGLLFSGWRREMQAHTHTHTREGTAAAAAAAAGLVPSLLLLLLPLSLRWALAGRKKFCRARASVRGFLVRVQSVYKRWVCERDDQKETVRLGRGERERRRRVQCYTTTTHTRSGLSAQ